MVVMLVQGLYFENHWSTGVGKCKVPLGKTNVKAPWEHQDRETLGPAFGE